MENMTPGANSVGTSMISTSRILLVSAGIAAAASLGLGLWAPSSHAKSMMFKPGMVMDLTVEEPSPACNPVTLANVVDALEVTLDTEPRAIYRLRIEEDDKGNLLKVHYCKYTLGAKPSEVSVSKAYYKGMTPTALGTGVNLMERTFGKTIAITTLKADANFDPRSGGDLELIVMAQRSLVGLWGNTYRSLPIKLTHPKIGSDYVWKLSFLGIESSQLHFLTKFKNDDFPNDKRPCEVNRVLCASMPESEVTQVGVKVVQILAPGKAPTQVLADDLEESK